MKTTLNVLKIIDGTTVDGPGFRTSIYFAGCNHHCPGCHNPQSWDLNGGTPLSINEIMARIIENDFDVTFSGGDPLLQIEPLTQLAQKIHESGKNIWCYTGYKYEEIIDDLSFIKITPYIDVIVDGRFELALRDTSLLFKGSSNQRLIDLQKSMTVGKPVIWQSSF